LDAAREGIEDRDYLAESKGIFGIPEKVTPILNPQKARLLVDVPGHSLVIGAALISRPSGAGSL
jgi:hypothetical protein